MEEGEIVRFKKLISSSLAIGLLFNSISISSANTISEDGRYEIFEGSDITINNMLEEDEADVEIEGDTLVNVLDYNNVTVNKDWNYNYDNKTGYIKLSDKATEYKTAWYDLNKEAELNKEYTMYINITKNTLKNDDSLSGAVAKVAFLQDSGTKYISVINKNQVGAIKYVFNPSENSRDKAYVSVFIGSYGGELEYKDFMIIEGNHLDKDISFFEGMKSVGQNDIDGHKIKILSNNSDKTQIDKTEIPLKEPLRGLPNGVKDRIVKINGRWVIERNCGEIIFDGSELWAPQLNQPDGKTMVFIADLGEELSNRKTGSINFIFNKFINYTNYELQTQVDFECASLNANKIYKTYAYIRINKSKLNTADENGIKEWIKKNPVSVVYELEKPVYEPIEFDSLKLYLNTTHIKVNSIIPANLKVTVDRVANRAKEYSELAKTNPTIENISKARMWTNLMRESILKDEFQNNIDDIIEITDMSLERKSASVNLDVYIKSENILLMSLDTNSITFEDFSGIEDVENINAINININSSLPYQLNAYLPAEIQNADKSNTIDKRILNIKENGESDYETFNNINEKVVLKDNNPAGNNLSHGIDIKLKSGIAHEKDVYKTTIKFEAQQK